MTTRFALRIGPRAEVQQCSIETFVKKRSYLNLSMFFLNYLLLYTYTVTHRAKLQSDVSPVHSKHKKFSHACMPVDAREGANSANSHGRVQFPAAKGLEGRGEGER